MKHAGLLFLLLFTGLWAGAQEVLEPIFTNPVLTAKGANPFVSAVAKDNHFQYIYLVDTLELPFVDDFSRDNIKDYEAAAADPSAVQIYPWSRFLVDGVHQDTVSFSREPVWQYTFINGVLDSMETQPIHVTFHNPSWPFNIDSVIRVWAVSIQLQLDTSDSTFHSIYPLYTNLTDTFAVVSDDPRSRWVGRNANVNQSFGILPPTIGVATFDGLDSTGYPHDFSVSTTYGGADQLTSKAIDLEYLAEDSLILSFWYQPQGNGNAPEAEDSLALHFLAKNGQWQSVWGIPGGLLQDFQQVFITITDTSYLYNGFRFRFLNYGTLSGALDHWSIDYVRLDQNRSSVNDLFEDVAFLANPRSLLKTWTAMPYDHYKLSPGSYMVGSFDVDMRNLSPSSKIVPNIYRVRDADGALLHTSSTFNNGSFAPGIDLATMLVDSGSNTFQFPSVAGQRNKFTVVNYIDIGVLNDDNQENDTIFYTQNFDSFYAYDDGSVEKGYGLVGVSAQMLNEFQIPVSDTLKAVHFYFPPILENTSDENFRLVVWTGENGPETLVYRSVLKAPLYTPLNEFQRYDLDTTMIVSGKIYVGLEQIGSARLYVGFDENVNSAPHIWYNTNGNWQQTQFTGSLMIRPDFADAEPSPVGLRELPVAQEPDVQVYPNPTNGLLHIRASDSPVNVRLYDLYGRALVNRTAVTSETLDLAPFSAGVYLLHLSSLDGRAVTTRRIVRID